MIRTLALFSLLGSITLLTACSDSSSTQFPAETTHIDGEVNNENPAEYSGRALDGYLRDAVVWLDMNDNGQWDTYTIDVLVTSEEDPEGIVEEKTFPEPFAMTGEGGRFTLDISPFNRDPRAGADLEAEDYPLVMLAIPGLTYDEGLSQLVDRGFFMLAPPGVTTISPFTTLVDMQRRRLGLPGVDKEEVVKTSAKRVKQNLGEGFESGNFMNDYIKSENGLMRAYGEAIVALLKSQISDELNESLRVALDAGTLEESLSSGALNVLDNDRIRVLSEVYFLKAANIIEQVNELVATQGVDGFSVGQIDLNPTEVDEQNPLLLTTETFYMNPFDEDGFVGRTTVRGVEQKEKVSAVIQYDYSAAGQITRIEVNGRTEMNLRELLRVLNAEGRASALGQQRFPGLYIRETSADIADLEGEDGVETPSVDEVYTFDWENREISLDTTNLDIDTSGAGELDDTAEVTFSWDVDSEGRVTTIRQTLSGDSSIVDPQTFEVNSYGTGVTPVKTSLTVDGSLDETRVYQGLESCAPPSSADEEGRRKPDQNRSIDVYAGSESDPLDFVAIDVFATRDGEPRLMKELFDFTFATSAGGEEGPVRVAWINRYHDDSAASDALEPDQKSLLERRGLVESTGSDRDCSSEPEVESNYVGSAKYSYQKLADYLLEIASGE